MLITVADVFSQLEAYTDDLALWRAGQVARLTTSLAGANRNLRYTAKVSGTDGTLISVAYVNPGTAGQPLSVSVSGPAITVNLATDGAGVVTSTAAQVKAGIEGAPAAAALVTISYPFANNGSGVVAAMAATNLESAQVDSIMQFTLAKQNAMETALRITYDRQTIKTKPEASLVQGTDYDITEDPYDFSLPEWQNYCNVRLRRRPVRTVDRVRMVYGDALVFTFPTEWIHVKRDMGILDLVPTPGTGWSAALTSGYFLPFLAGATFQANIPQIICVDYKVGGISEGDWPDFPVYDHMVMLARLAAREVLVELSDLYKPGLASESIAEDGLSESTQFTRGGKLKYGDKIAQIDADYQNFLKENRYKVAPINFQVM